MVKTSLDAIYASARKVAAKKHSIMLSRHTTLDKLSSESRRVSVVLKTKASRPK